MEYIQVREKIQQAFWRKVRPIRVHINMKACIDETHIERQGCYSILFSILLILTWGLQYPQKVGVKRKKKSALK